MTAPGAQSGPAGSPPSVGRLAEEAALLLDVFAARLALIRSTVGDAVPGEAAPGSDTWGPVDPAVEDSATAVGHPQCVGWCPVCRSADLLRGERPEVAGKLVDSAIVVVTALRSLLPAAPATDQTATDQTAADRTTTDRTTTDQTSTDQPASGIERIAIR